MGGSISPFVGMNRAQRCDGHKRYQSEGGQGCLIVHITCGHFDTSMCHTSRKRLLRQSNMANTLQVHSSDDESSLCPEPSATPSTKSPWSSWEAQETLAASESCAIPSPPAPCPSLETPEFTVGYSSGSLSESSNSPRSLPDTIWYDSEGITSPQSLSVGTSTPPYRSVRQCVGTLVSTEESLHALEFNCASRQVLLSALIV